jgi:cation transport ATPase
VATDPVPHPEKPAVNAELIERFVDNQSREIATRQLELELEKQKDAHNFEFGKEAIAAQERDRKDERSCRREMQKDGQRTVLLVVAILALLILGTLWLGSPQIAMELTKAILYIAAGLAGGYGLAKSKKRSSEDQKEEH